MEAYVKLVQSNLRPSNENRVGMSIGFGSEHLELVFAKKQVIGLYVEWCGKIRRLYSVIVGGLAPAYVSTCYLFHSILRPDLILLLQTTKFWDLVLILILKLNETLRVIVYWRIVVARRAFVWDRIDPKKQKLVKSCVVIAASVLGSMVIGGSYVIVYCK